MLCGVFFFMILLYHPTGGLSRGFLIFFSPFCCPPDYPRAASAACPPVGHSAKLCVRDHRHVAKLFCFRGHVDRPPISGQRFQPCPLDYVPAVLGGAGAEPETRVKIAFYARRDDLSDGRLRGNYQVDFGGTSYLCQPLDDWGNRAALRGH